MDKETVVDELLKYFQKEDERLKRYGIPKTYEEKRHFLRGIINMRMPLAIPIEILKLEDSLLQMELEEKKLTDVKDIDEVIDHICLWQGDITTIRVDAIVNACNSSLIGCFIPNHSCIDNAIHTYSGIRLRLACNQIMHGNEAEVGQAELTDAYNLPSKYVIHAVGPMVLKKLTSKETKELELCYKTCLDIAKKNKIKTIAFPCISTGIYHFPKDKACQIAIETVKSYLRDNPNVFDKIVFCVFSNEDYAIYDEYLKNE